MWLKKKMSSYYKNISLYSTLRLKVAQYLVQLQGFSKQTIIFYTEMQCSFGEKEWLPSHVFFYLPLF